MRLFVGHFKMLPLRNWVTMPNRHFIPHDLVRLGIMHQVLFIRGEFLHRNSIKIHRKKRERKDAL